MKKRIVAIACAFALALAMPALAFAAPSPTTPDPVTGNNGVVINVKAGSGAVESVTASDVHAKNVPAGTTVHASFVVKGNAKDVTLTFNIGKQYAGYSCTVYVEHDGGATEAIAATVSADGTISVHVDGLSTFSVVMGAAGSGAADGSAKSPQTGVDFGTVAGATAVTAIAAGAVFVALRKKVTE
ncbi:MAG: NPXTG-anchored protein [Gordonibacter sp.]|uniref:NPXTG-anchored protein n=1 Tax=Gordonibacter sp. TaxID=1968902 RepID=UPI002FCAC2C9